MYTNLRMFAVRVRVSVTMSRRLFSSVVLAGRPRTPRAPTSVNRIGKHRTLGDLLMPMICQIILLRCLGALHEMFVPSAIRLLGVQARLTAPMTITLNSRYAKRRKALRCGLAKHLTQTIFAVYNNVIYDWATYLGRHNLQFRWYYWFIFIFDVISFTRLIKFCGHDESCSLTARGQSPCRHRDSACPWGTATSSMVKARVPKLRRCRSPVS